MRIHKALRRGADTLASGGAVSITSPAQVQVVRPQALSVPQTTAPANNAPAAVVSPAPVAPATVAPTPAPSTRTRVRVVQPQAPAAGQTSTPASGTATAVAAPSRASRTFAPAAASAASTNTDGGHGDPVTVLDPHIIPQNPVRWAPSLDRPFLDDFYFCRVRAAARNMAFGVSPNAARNSFAK